MSNSETNLLEFPVQIKPSEGYLSDDQLACQVRMKLVKKLNLHMRGEYIITEEDKEDIITANDVFRRNGYQPIDVDIDEL